MANYHWYAIREWRDLTPFQFEAIEAAHAQRNNEITNLGISNVFWCRVRQRYIAQHYKNGVCLMLGSFDELWEAELDLICS